MFSICFLCFFSFCVSTTVSQGFNYQEAFFLQKIDHFNFESFGSGTYRQRYLYNDSWWAFGQGPIFFYAGNEGPIDSFWENSGFIMESAQEFRALVVFAEHRFYGKSLPFGNESFNPSNVGVLSIEQALADYAFLLKAIKQNLLAENCPVIVFGGSFGGVLASYMRFKYPNLVQGAIASSAPIYMMAGMVPVDLIFQKVTKDFRGVSQKCEDQIRSAFALLAKWASYGKSGLDMISQTFRLCKPLTSAADYDHLLRWARNAMFEACLMDYPYSTSFLGYFPAYPVNVMCDLIGKEENLASGLRSAVGLLYNSTQDLDCFDIFEEYYYCSDPTGCFDPGRLAWDYQACTEVYQVGGTDGVKDMFPVLPYTSDMRDAHCKERWNVTPSRDWMEVMYWGKDISSSSNIVFSNGALDPCATEGGVLHNISDTIVSIMIEGAAHHMDLRGSNEADPPSVRQARNFEKEIIAKWIREFHLKKFP